MRKVVEQTTCDRCGTKVDEGDVPEDLGESPEVIFCMSGSMIEGLDKAQNGKIKFNDLCEKCSNRIASLIEAALKTGKSGPKKAKKSKTVRTKNSKKSNKGAAPPEAQPGAPA